VKTHLARSLAAQTVCHDNFAQATLRTLKAATSRGLRILFHNT
jgi:hypothetical protein